VTPFTSKILKDGWWQLNCDLELNSSPEFKIEKISIFKKVLSIHLKNVDAPTIVFSYSFLFYWWYTLVSLGCFRANLMLFAC